jgi:hypothetical protein
MIGSSCRRGPGARRPRPRCILKWSTILGMRPTTPTTPTTPVTRTSALEGGCPPGPASSGPLPANVAAALQSLYQEYESQGGGDTFTPSQPSDKLLQISGTRVAVRLKLGSDSDFNTALAQIQSDGMQVSASSPTYGLIEGLLPIAELPAAAQVAASVTPVPPPVLF